MPPKIKIYEGLGCIGDGRIEVNGNEAKVYSSSGNKTYSVLYDPDNNAIMANDNGSYWQGYLGYPSIAFLMKVGLIKYDMKYASALKGLPWKDINIKFKNDFSKTVEHVHSILSGKGIDTGLFITEIDNIYLQIKKLSLSKLGTKIKPPKEY